MHPQPKWRGLYGPGGVSLGNQIREWHFLNLVWTENSPETLRVVKEEDKRMVRLALMLKQWLLSRNVLSRTWPLLAQDSQPTTELSGPSTVLKSHQEVFRHLLLSFFHYHSCWLNKTHKYLIISILSWNLSS